MIKTQELVDDLSCDNFELNYPINYAVIRCLEIIGEAEKRIPDNVREMTPDIPWTSMAGMRDRLIHGYDNINLGLVWETVKNVIPEMIPKFEIIKKKL